MARHSDEITAPARARIKGGGDVAAIGRRGSASERRPEESRSERLSNRPSSLLALLALAAAAVAAVVRAATPFDHGIWLVAYLFLVGFLAQILLGWGQDSLCRRAGRLRTVRVDRAEAALWNLGVVAVPLGVLVNARIAVVIGSGVLLVALALFARSLSPSPKSHDAIPTAMAYAALLFGMATSVVIGTGLAWDIPWV